MAWRCRPDRSRSASQAALAAMARRCSAAFSRRRAAQTSSHSARVSSIRRPASSICAFFAASAAAWASRSAARSWRACMRKRYFGLRSFRFTSSPFLASWENSSKSRVPLPSVSAMAKSCFTVSRFGRLPSTIWSASPSSATSMLPEPSTSNFRNVAVMSASSAARALSSPWPLFSRSTLPLAAALSRRFFPARALRSSAFSRCRAARAMAWRRVAPSCALTWSISCRAFSTSLSSAPPLKPYMAPTTTDGGSPARCFRPYHGPGHECRLNRS
mmetsp:Transcript_35571/g.120531  ORF Transcript_35571/g.120531 Transcript_35571/m.120531 type:complete len:273 (-) Transcript_35571:99-917(-)